MATNKRDWALTGEALERLLDLLDEDREQAGRKYEIVRRKLLAFFEARGSEAPDLHADETIDRVARKIVDGEKIEHLDKYIYGVARLVWLESLRGRDKAPVSLDLTATPVAENYEEQQREQGAKEQNFECFESCLEKLPPAQRSLIIAYYREEAGLKLELRRRQAQELGMTLNALRLRASRIRAELSACITDCLKHFEADTKTAIYH